MDADFEGPPAKRRRTAYHHKHRIRHHEEVPAGELLSQKILDVQMTQAIKTICEEIAFRQGIEHPQIDSVALESLRALTDDFQRELCSLVSRSMHNGRRIVPLAPDFEAALKALNVPRPDDQLLACSTKLESLPQRSYLPSPPPEDEFHTSHELPRDFLGPQLSRQTDLNLYSSNIKSLPPLPSAHTYKTTPVIDQRETDTRRIRELATEEGKLGEAALRKLAAASNSGGESVLSEQEKYVKDNRPRWIPASRQKYLTQEAIWDTTLRELLAQERAAGRDFELGPEVNCEKKWRMPDDWRQRRRHVAVSRSPTIPKNVASGERGAKRYDLLPPTMSASKSYDLAPPAAAHASPSRARPDPDETIEL